jgi:hypothetical protein
VGAKTPDHLVEVAEVPRLGHPEEAVVVAAEVAEARLPHHLEAADRIPGHREHRLPLSNPPVREEAKH